MITNNFVLHFVGGQAEQKENKRLKTEENNYLFLERKYEYVTKIFFYFRLKNVEINTFGFIFKKNYDSNFFNEYLFVIELIIFITKVLE